MRDKDYLTGESVTQNAYQRQVVSFAGVEPPLRQFATQVFDYKCRRKAQPHVDMADARWLVDL